MTRTPPPPRPRPATELDQAISGSGATILVAATPLFASSGMQEVTIRQIAAAAGVNSQLIYYYFGDKPSLLRAALEGRGGPRGNVTATRRRKRWDAAEKTCVVYNRPGEGDA